MEIANCPYYSALLFCFQNYCDNLVNGCDSQYSAGKYVVNYACAASAPYFPAEVLATGGYSCPIGMVRYDQRQYYQAIANVCRPLVCGGTIKEVLDCLRGGFLALCLYYGLSPGSHKNEDGLVNGAHNDINQTATSLDIPSTSFRMPLLLFVELF
ncbi:hypothetical protein V1517DRAFT_189618 [Lipomyces orientalis]|uniref:Uncharacterized protein n=1 Tax=Lipomyces orientalis TaxID=1233043 RepID=A0ACC3TIH0_9ASCO